MALKAGVVGLLLAGVVVLSGCEESTPAESASNFIPSYWGKSEVCYDGVVYIDRYRHLSVKFLPSGSPATVTRRGVSCLINE